MPSHHQEAEVTVDPFSPSKYRKDSSHSGIKSVSCLYRNAPNGKLQSPALYLNASNGLNAPNWHLQSLFRYLNEPNGKVQRPVQYLNYRPVQH
ncbi:hypothetical protein E4U26_006280 [Claviceps purpurea]|nr:hypothetical protein E4U26_006280 [Claviceps purpurea]